MIKKGGVLIVKKVFISILVIFIPLYLLLKTVEINTFNKDFYLSSFHKYGVVEVTGKNLDELDKITEDLFTYLKGESDKTILESNFNQREILHMEDVKKLFDYGFALKNLSFLLSALILSVIIIRGKFKSLGKGLFYGIFIWWGSILILLLLAMSDFNRYFTYFHLIFFDNELWILNPKTDLLIQMLPEVFFSSIFKNIILLFLVMLAILQIIGFILMKKGKDSNGRIVRF